VTGGESESSNTGRCSGVPDDREDDVPQDSWGEDAAIPSDTTSTLRAGEGVLGCSTTAAVAAWLVDATGLALRAVLTRAAVVPLSTSGGCGGAVSTWLFIPGRGDDLLGLVVAASSRRLLREGRVGTAPWAGVEVSTVWEGLSSAAGGRAGTPWLCPAARRRRLRKACPLCSPRKG